MWARLLFVYSKINPSQVRKGQTNKNADGKWTWKWPSQIKPTRNQAWVGLIYYPYCHQYVVLSVDEQSPWITS